MCPDEKWEPIMKVVKLEAITVRVPYKRVESSSLINRGGITDVIDRKSVV